MNFVEQTGYPLHFVDDHPFAPLCFRNQIAEKRRISKEINKKRLIQQV